MSASSLPLPPPDLLPASFADLAAALRAVKVGASTLSALAEPASRATLRAAMFRPAPAILRTLLSVGPKAAALRLAPPSRPAEAEQREHDRYFEVDRIGHDADAGFIRGLVLAYASTCENAETMGVTLLDEADWAMLFDGLEALIGVTDRAGGVRPRLPAPTGWRDGYDPALRWLVGHQLFFALIQGAIVGLHCFASARVAASVSGATIYESDEADRGLALAAAFMRSSAAAMKFTSDFAEKDYDATVRPAMAPPAVREGFSGLQTRDHAYLVRLFTALKPVLGAGEPTDAHHEFVESVVSAYAAHEFICARFRGDVLPSLRMAANSNGRSQRSGVEVIRDMMRARLALIDARTTPLEPVE